MTRDVRSPQYPAPNPPSRFGCWSFFWVFAAGIFTWLAVIAWLISRDYAQGEQAYKQANCQEAIAHFDRLMTRWPLIDMNDYEAAAQAKKSECLAFQEALKQQDAGELSTALVAYNDFMARYPSSDLISVIQQQTDTIFAKAEPAALAQPPLCEKIHSFKLEADRLLPLYRACGDLYTGKQDYTKAIAMYERILEVSPNSELASQVKVALAQSMIAEAKQKGAAEILPPQSSGIIGTGDTVVQIQNDSPTKLRFVFTGPETRFEEIEPCQDCQVYDTGPDSCPKKGPVHRYNLQPGQYELVVKSIGEVGTIPFTGNWSLANGNEYRHCFVIVKNLTERDRDRNNSTEPKP